MSFFQMVRKGKEFPLILKIVLGRGPQNEKPVRLQNALPRDGQWHHVTITQDRNEVHLGVDSEAPGSENILQRFLSDFFPRFPCMVMKWASDVYFQNEVE